MKIRTQVMVSMAFFGIALLIISASMITTNQHVDRLIKQEDLAKNVELKANELSYLSNDYLLFQEAPQLDRWELKYASLSEDLSNLTVDSADQQVLVNNIRDNQQRLRDVFREIVASIGNKTPDQQLAADPSFIQVSWNRIGVQTRGIVFDASRLGQKLQDEKNELMLFNYLLIIALLGTFGVFILTNYYLIYRRTLKSISDLQAGTQIIGSGNLDHTIPEKNGDEFGELAGAFNRMTRELKSVTASKSDLEKEITERKRAEDALRAGEEKYRTIVETATEGIWMADTDGRTTFVNKRMAEMIGYSPEEMIGKPAYDFMDEEARSILRQNLIRRRDGFRDSYEQKYIRKDGSIFWAIVSAIPLQYNDGQIIAIMGMLTDITERKQAEILSNALNNINLVINSSLDFNRIMETVAVEATKAIGFSRATIALKDDDGWVLKYTFGSPQRPIGFRYSAEEVQSISHMIGQKKPIILNDLQNNPTSNREEAKRYDVASSVLLPLVANGEVIGLLSFFDSVTVKLTGAQVDFVNKLSTSLALAISNAHLYNQLRNELEVRKQTEEALRKSEAELLITNESLQTKQGELQVQAEEMEIQLEELRAANEELEKVTGALRASEETSRRHAEELEKLMDVVPAAIWVSHDPHCHEITGNKAANRFYEAKEGDNVSAGPAYIVQDTTRRFFRDGRELMPDELTMQEAAAKGVDVLESELEVVLPSGRHMTILGNASPLRDEDGNVRGCVGAFVDITGRKRAEKELLEAKMQAELYLDLMGHDINNMHQIAIGYLELALEALDLEEDEKILISRPLETMQRSAKLIDNVRKLQRVHAGEIKEDLIDLDDILSRAVCEFRETARGNIRYNNGHGPHKVMANELLYDVFANLIGNAIKHAGSNGTIITISVGTVWDNGKEHHVVRVDDNGPGIPDGQKDKIFNRLQRGETKTRGVGLGLYLVKSLVESYHGRVWVEDRVAGDHTKGSRFVVMLPAI